MEDRCVMCGRIIPEGRQICHLCEQGKTPKYESPIKIIESTMDSIYKDIVKKKDDAIFAEIQTSFGVDLDRDELIRALQYDRNQYEKGYADGKRAAMDELVRCKDCKHFDKLFKEEWAINKIGTCYLRKEEGIETAQECDDFCSYGERRENERTD